MPETNADPKPVTADESTSCGATSCGATSGGSTSGGATLPCDAGMSALVREFDWSATKLGAERDWPQSLRTLVYVILNAKQPMFLAWGAERTWLYNDAFVPILGDKHPSALGQPSMQVWQEARTDLEPLFDKVFAGEAVHIEGFTVGLDRHGSVENATFDFSYTPARDDTGQVAGLFGVCVETTKTVLAEQMLRQEVAERTREAVQRRRAEHALRDLAASLEEQVIVRTQERDRVQKRAQQELAKAQEALRQAQKMEAIGQLTGGIAHDFNNLLAAISVSLQVLRARLARGEIDRFEHYVEMGQDGVRRAATLTQHLLAFARRQTLDPKPTDVSRLVDGMSELMRRAVGPEVRVVLQLSPETWLTRIDPSQLESSLINLCINARDAMQPHGGVLTILTANESLDAAAAALLQLPAGEYVSLDVHDTGPGIADDCIERIFDPFFTTKPMGHGTGLGLSMVYGFVRQSGGQVTVESKPGEGARFRLRLPRHDGVETMPVELPQGDRSFAGRGESILVVEDEPTIREVVAEALTEQGYHVTTASDGAAALDVLASRARVDLLLTDVGLPGGINGRQVACAAREARPTLKVLYMTGYAEGAENRDHLIEPGTAVLSKPLEIATALQRMRSLLEEP